jgi:hypothetical protein
MENKLIAYKNIMRIRQEYKSVYGEYVDGHKVELGEFATKNRKNNILNHFSKFLYMIEWAKTPSHANISNPQVKLRKCRVLANPS